MWRERLDYTIELSKNHKYLRVKALSPVTTDIVRRWSEDLVERSRELNIRCFLFDVRSVSNVSSVLENYFFAYEDTTALGLSRNNRAAILVSEEDRSHNFAETTLRNFGYDVRIFTDESAAIEWLGKKVS